MEPTYNDDFNQGYQDAPGQDDDFGDWGLDDDEDMNEY